MPKKSSKSLTKSQKDKVVYIDETHTYLINGCVVPSVSTLVKFATGNTYKNINPEVLKRASEYGTSVHEAIENYELNNVTTDSFLEQIETYKKLKEESSLKVKEMEQIVHFGTHFCGRYDILDESGFLWDIKTTSKVHKENLEWQLGLYYLGLGSEKSKGFCLWLPKKGKAKVVEIVPKSNAECKELVELYEEYIAESEDLFPA